MKTFIKAIQKQFKNLVATGKLFRSEIYGSDIWICYLNSFESDTNPVFRDPDSTIHNCNNCHNFIRRYGNIVAIDSDGRIITLFSNLDVEAPYKVVAEAIDKLLKKSGIGGVFFETYDSLNSLPYEKCNKRQSEFQLGIPQNFKRYTVDEALKYGVVEPDEVREFNHFNLKLPAAFVDMSGKSIESIKAFYKDKNDVFKRAMKEIPLDTLLLVKDLINQGSLLDGTTHLAVIEGFIKVKTLHNNCPYSNKNNWNWVVTYDMTEAFAKFKNTLIGVLCTELAEGMELNKACQNWNKRVDPANYHKATAPITARMKEEAKKEFYSLGYTDRDLIRRLATIDDIKASEILHMNSGNGEIKEVSLFDEVKTTSTRHKRAKFEDVEEVSIETFMNDILPSCETLEILLKNSHQNNLVTLTTSDSNDKPMFKWDNPYSWTFNGNLAGKSMIKNAVKTAGGDVNGVLRFSIMWAENNGDNSDLDAHCKEPRGGTHIYYGKKNSVKTGGVLDIDITNPVGQMPNGSVENITYPSLNKMIDGRYELIVHQFTSRNSQGFKAEIEFNDETYYYEYDRPVKGYVNVANITLKNGEFSIEHKLPEINQSKELWGLETNKFHKVNLACLSPNHWGNNNIGNKHYMFMLDSCKPDVNIRGFHNENLTTELLKHRKVMEVLGNTVMVEPGDNQLAGVGFNSTVRDEVVVKCSGSFQRMLKIKF